MFFFFLMRRRPPRSTRTDTLFPYTTLFRSGESRRACFETRLQALGGAPQHEVFLRSAKGLPHPEEHGRAVARARVSTCLREAEAASLRRRRSEARRVGQECVSTRRSRWSPYP